VTAGRTSEKSQQNVEINSHKSRNLEKILNIFEKYLKMVFIILSCNNIIHKALIHFDFIKPCLECKCGL